MSKPAKINWIRWKDACQSLLMAGAMKDFSRSDVGASVMLLRKMGLLDGTVLHKKEGSKELLGNLEPSKFVDATKP